MTPEHAPGGQIYSESILTVDDNGEEVRVPIADIAELRQEPYHWGDAMVVNFDSNEGDDE